MAVVSGHLAAFWRQTSAASVAATGEAMTQDGTTLWYYVDDRTKQAWDKDSTITVYDGATPVTPAEYDYGSGYVLLASAPSGAVTADFKYFAMEQVLGAYGWNLDTGMALEECQTFGDVAKEYTPTIHDFSGTVDMYWWTVKATLTTSIGGESDLTFTAVRHGTPGNSITIEYIDPGTTGSISVAVVGSAIAVTLAYADGAVTSTASDVLDAIEASATASALVTVALASGCDGTGLVEDMNATALSGGVNADNVTSLTGGADVLAHFYTDDSASSKKGFRGVCYLEKVSASADTNGLVKQTLSFRGHGTPYYREG